MEPHNLARRNRAPAGRLEEQQLCTRWLGEAAGGRPRVVLVEGEAGVGKTTLVEATLAVAAERGAVIGSATFQPHDIAHRAALEAFGAVLEPEDLPDPAPAGPAADRSPERVLAEVFGRTGRALVERARTDTVVVSLDDLHWADPPSVDLLGLLLAAVAQASAAGALHLCVVLSGRQGDEMSAGTGRLAALHRYPGTRTLTLRPPTETALGQILAQATGRRLAPRLVRSLYEVTGGLPLHAELLVEGGMERGDVLDADGVLSDAPGFRRRVLQRSIEDEVLDMLDHLDDGAREVLAVAACLGTAGPTPVLRVALGHDAGLLDGLDPAVERLLRVDESFRFRHPQVHRAVARSEDRRSRAARHCRLAVHLDAGLPPDTATASLVDRQLRLGGDGVEPTLVYRTTRAVADHALSTAAWSQATQAYERATDAATRIGLDRTRLAGLHLRAGTAAAHDHDAATAAEHFGESIRIARADGDLDTWGRAALGLGRALITSGQDHIMRRQPIEELQALVAELGAERSDLAARCQELLAEIAFSAGDFGDGFACTSRARDLAGDAPDVLALVDFAEGLQFMGALQLDRAEELFRSSHAHALDAGDPWVGLWGLTRSVLVDLLRGDAAAASASAAAAAGASAALGNWAEHTIALACGAWVANLRGEFALAEERSLEAAEFLHRSDYAFGPLMVFPQLAWSRAVRGDHDGAGQALDDWAGFGARGTELAGLIIRAALSPDDPRTTVLRADPGLVTINSVAALAASAEVARAGGDRRTLAELAGRLAATAAAGTHCTPMVSMFLDRFAAYAGVDTPDSAVADRLAGAAERAADLGLVLEAARCTLERAEVLAAAEPDRAAALTESALAEFHRMDALALAVRAERLLGSLGPATSGAPAPSPLSRTILFTDIVDSTRRNAELGDAAFLEVLRSHNDLIRARLRQFGGTEFKHTGDGVAVWFRTADDAAAYCLAVQEDLGVLAGTEPEFGLAVRMGLASGIPLENEGDLFGLAVVRAARVCDRAGAGQVLVAEEVAGHLDRGRFATVVVGDVALKGLPQPVRLHRLRPPTGS